MPRREMTQAQIADRSPRSLQERKQARPRPRSHDPRSKTRSNRRAEIVPTKADSPCSREHCRTNRQRRILSRRTRRGGIEDRKAAGIPREVPPRRIPSVSPFDRDRALDGAPVRRERRALLPGVIKPVKQNRTKSRKHPTEIVLRYRPQHRQCAHVRRETGRVAETSQNIGKPSIASRDGKRCVNAAHFREFC